MAFKAPVYWLKYTAAMIEEPTKTICRKNLDPLIDLYHKRIHFKSTCGFQNLTADFTCLQNKVSHNFILNKTLIFRLDFSDLFFNANGYLRLRKIQ